MGSAKWLVLWLVVWWRPLSVATVLVVVARWPLVLWLVLRLVVLLVIVVVIVRLMLLLLLLLRRRLLLVVLSGGSLILHHGLQVAVVLRVPAAVEVALLLLHGRPLVARSVRTCTAPGATCGLPVILGPRRT